jgi:hypothetical protein
MSKQKQDNQSALDSLLQILTHDAAEAPICCLMTQFKINPTLLHHNDSAGLLRLIFPLWNLVL